MLWLCLHFPALPVELHQSPENDPLAVIERHASRRWILACNAAAQALKVFPGLDVTRALALTPTLQLLERAVPQERQALEALAAWSYQWSSEIVVDAPRWAVSLEIGASVRYFGGLDALCDQIANGISLLGYSARVGVAPTCEAAALLAVSDRPARITALDVLPTVLGGRPLLDLAVAPAVHGQLQRAGLKTIGEILAIPRAALARRFGPPFTDYLQRLLGERPDPRRRFRMPERYRRALECPYPIDTAQALLFPLQRVLQELQGYLRGRDRAVQCVSIALKHRKAPATGLEIRVSTPQRDAAHFLPLLREQLERTPLRASVTQIVVSADRFLAPAYLQPDLFEPHTALDGEWSEVLDRLRARLGDEAIRELHLVDDHRPERVGCSRARPDPADDPLNPLPDRPFWLLTPRRLHTHPKLLGHPERIECGWWEGRDEVRDYYVAETAQGALWWVYRDARSKEWYLHGLWA